MNICGMAEKRLYELDPLRTLLYYLFLAFFIFLTAKWFGLSDISYGVGTYTKKLGVYWSVNWTITFLVLYPLFLFLAIGAARDVRSFWKDAADWHIVTGSNGARKSPPELLGTWEAWLSKSNLVIIAFFFISVVTAATDFVETSARPLFACDISFIHPKTYDVPLDWLTMPIVNGGCKGRSLELVIIGGAFYFLLILSLFFFLAFLYYSGSIFVFLARLSRRDGDHRLVFRPSAIRDSTAPLVENLMSAVVLGLAACALMQAHYAYLKSAAPDPIVFLTGDIGRLGFGFLGNPANALTTPPEALDFLNYQAQTIEKGAVVIPAVVTVLLIGLVGIVTIYWSVRNALFYTRDKLKDKIWAKKIGFTKEEIIDIQNINYFTAFWRFVSPYGLIYVIVCAFLVLSVILSNFFVFLVSAAVIFLYRIAAKYFLGKSGSSPAPVVDGGDAD